jgi:Rrf2 family protein
MLFKKETEYALRALVYIQFQNTKGDRPGITEISNEIDTPHSFTAKILQRLVKQGFINSIKGKNGGFLFNPKKPDLNLKDVIIAIEGDRSFSGCGLGLKSCDENCQCPIHESYSPIREAMEKLLREETIQNLAKKINGKMDIVLNRLNETS